MTPEEIITEMNWTYDSDPGRYALWCNLIRPAMINYAAAQISETRQALADYMYSEGCRCCQNIDEHEEAKARLGELLGVEKYEDGSFNFSLYRSKENEP